MFADNSSHHRHGTEKLRNLPSHIGTGPQFSAAHSGNSVPCCFVLAVLTEEINRLTDHFKDHKHDYHSMRGLYKKVGRRKHLLAYLKKEDLDRYKTLIARLGLRK